MRVEEFHVNKFIWRMIPVSSNHVRIDVLELHGTKLDGEPVQLVCRIDEGYSEEVTGP